MPKEVMDPAILAALEGGQAAINRGSAAPAAGGRPGMFGGGKAAILANSKIKAATALERQLNTLQGYYDKDFKGIGPGSLLEYLPTQTTKRFNAAANGIRPSLKPLVRDPGEGAFTEGDQTLLDSLIPKAGNADSENEQQFKDLRAMIDATRKQYAPPAPTGFKIVARRRK